MFGGDRGTERKKGRETLGDDSCFEMVHPRLPKTGREERADETEEEGGSCCEVEFCQRYSSA